MNSQRYIKRIHLCGELLRNQLATENTSLKIFEVLQARFCETSQDKIKPFDLLDFILSDDQFLEYFQNDQAAIALNRIINQLVENEANNPDVLNCLLPHALQHALNAKNWRRVLQISTIHNKGISINDSWSQRSSIIETILWAKIANRKDLEEISQYFRIDLNCSRISYDKRFNATYIKASRIGSELPPSIDRDNPYQSYQAMLALIQLAKQQDFSNAIEGGIQLFHNPQLLRSSLSFYLVRELMGHLDDAFSLKAHKSAAKMLAEAVDTVIHTIAERNISAMADISLTDRDYTEALLCRVGCHQYARLIFKHSTRAVTDYDYFSKAISRYGVVTQDDVMSIYHTTNNESRLKNAFYRIEITPYLKFALESNQPIPFSFDGSNSNNGITVSSMSYFNEWNTLYKKVCKDEGKSELMINLLSDMIKSAEAFLDAKVFKGAESKRSLVKNLQECIHQDILNKIPFYKRSKLESDISL